MAVTINDIAKMAGVSLATVSRVLNNSGYVKDETRKKVLAVIKELNYTPSAIARSLSKNQTSTIGVIVPDIANPFFGEVIRGISEVADNTNLNIILCDSNESIKKELKSIKALREQRIRGLIISPTSADNDVNSEYLKTLNSLGIPVILVDGQLKYSNFSGIFVDNIKGSYDAVEALIKEGHKKIAIITGRMSSKPAKDRLLGYEKALIMNNIPLDPQYIFYGDYRQESGYNLTKEILSLKEKPTAIFVSNNLMTLGCINALFESNYKIPDDMSLISFDRIDLLNILGLKISHINGPSIELGRIGMNLLLDSLQKPEDLELKKITLTPELVLLGSEKLIK
ncbi:LacI family DNA-binding transcriptional regulator [Clostridium fallax]|uniref:Transcriptional regulator, LacI family n=1 Tax=Clostridium fallax TaxID=1533 RepID=A0A1M4TD09_9CLOT|nr:LacI family DNA-binding transcriptional regulator [Clostridium fallax]SHE42258.1 transcriptional regulator, LacI family [Clostridium fallax]SQB22704.1 LacI family transcriptional regulator [Clostridium fallax]